MSIQSEINRISGNVADALDAIEDKGVTVPAGSNSDDLADLIAQISGGGGGGIVISDTPDAAGGTIRTITGTVISGTKSITANGTGIDVASYAAVDVAVPQLDTSDANATATDIRSGKSGYVNGSKVNGSVTSRSSSDLTASGATVTVPAGIYDSQATKSVTSGTAGTPTASKGTVSNHSVSVTPSVTNTTGYITGSTKTGTAVTVSASELVSGSETKTANGTYDVTNLAELVVNVSGGSSKAIYMYQGFATRTANSYGSTSATVTVTKAGTYNISYVAIRGSSSGTMGTNLHIGNNTGTNNQTFNNGTYGQYATLTNQQIAANTAVTIYATSGNNSRSIYVGQLIVQEV